MKKNALLEIKNMDVNLIIQKIKETKKQIADSILDKNMGKLKDLKTIYKKKKDVAQMKTILRQKQLLEKLEKKGDKKS